MKHLHNRFIVLAMAFVAAVVLALPVTALAGQFKVSGPQNKSYNGQSHHFKSTVTDEKGKELVEGTDFVREYFYTNQRGYNVTSETQWQDSDDDMTAAGWVLENIRGINDYAGYGSHTVYHNIWTKYELKFPNVSMVEGEDEPSLAGTLSVLDNNPNNPISPSAFSPSYSSKEPGEYVINAVPDQKQIPTLEPTNTRVCVGDFESNGYHIYQVVGDDTSGFVQIKVIPGTLTITAAYTQVNVTVAWKDSSNKDGIRPSAEDFAKYLTLTADGEPTDAQAVIMENDNDTYTVIFDNVRKYAYDENGVRHEIDYQVTQANIDGYTTDNAAVGNEGTITNTHEIAAPAEKPAAKKTSRKAVPQTGDQSANAIAVVALGATVLGAAVVMKKRNEL